MNRGIILIFFPALLFLVTGFTTEQNDPIIIVGNTRFTIVTPMCIRIEYAENGNFVNDRTFFAENRSTFCTDFEVTRNEKEILINTGVIKLRYTPNGNFFSRDNLNAVIKKGNSEVEWFPGKTNEQNLGGTLTTLDGVEHAMKVNDGLLSRDGWYLIDDSGQKILKNDWVAERPFDSKIDWYLFGYGTEYVKALQSLTAISGNVPIVRKHVLGSWYCRWHDYTADDFREIVKEYKLHDFPLDIMVMDMGWHRMDATYGYGHAGMLGWTGFSWNKKLIPDPAGMLKEFKNDHIYVTLNVHPHDGIRDHEDMYPEFMQALGKDPATKENLPFNAGDKKYMDAYFKYAHEPNEKIGVDFWWIDWQQDHIYPYVFGYPNLKHLTWLNYLYYRNSEKGNKRGLGFSRWGGWGDQKHPIHFSGDLNSSWETLKFEVPFTANSGNVGCFFWAHDLGGFCGKRNPEQFARWMQFGLTNATFRIHSAGEDLDRRPWLWGADIEKSIKIIYHFRSQLIPYIYSSIWQCYSQTLPLLRPMYLEYPRDENAFSNPQEFLFGDNILSAPVVTPGVGPDKVAKQKVWFPEGSWYNIFSNEKYDGTRTDSVSANLYEFPLYVRGGRPIPMQPYSQRMTSEPLKNLIIFCYPGEKSEENQYDFYEDDGQTNDYLRGKYAITTLKYKRTNDKTIITIMGTKGEYTGQSTTRAYQVELVCTQKATKAFVDGKSVKAQYDNINYKNIIRIPETSCKENHVIEINASEAVQSEIIQKAAEKRKQK